MSEIRRFSVVQFESGQLASFGPDRGGPFCYYVDLLWYQRQYWMSMVVNAVLVVAACGILATLLVYEKAARGPVQVPIGAAEKMGLLHEMEAIKKSRDDYKALALNYKAQINVLNSRVDGHVSQLAALQARGKELDRPNKEQAQRMSTHQGVVLEAKRVLGVPNVQIVER